MSSRGPPEGERVRDLEGQHLINSTLIQRPSNQDAQTIGSNGTESRQELARKHLQSGSSLRHLVGI